MGKKYKADKISIGGHTLDADRMVILDSVIEGGAHSEAGYTSNTGTVTTVGVTAGVGISVSIANRTTEPQITLTNTGYYFQGANTGYVGSGGMQNWNTQESTPSLNPTTDWFTSLRIGHGHPVDYYSNTLGIQMTGGDSGRIYTRTITGGSAGSWKKYYHTGDFSTADVAKGVTAHGWGNHADEGYLTSYTDTDTNTQLTTAQIAAMGYIKENEDRRHKVLRFTGEGSNSNNSVINYGIYQEGGAWTHPYPDLVIGMHTGIKIGGAQGYNGTRFYSDAPGRSGAVELMSVGDGDGNVRVTNVAYAGNSFRAPIFYDSNDTNYYLNPAGTSSINGLELNGDVDMKDQVGRWITSDVFNDAIGWNNSYGVYIGSNVGGTHYLRGNGTFTTDGSTYTLYHTGNLPSIPSGNSIIDWTANQGSTNIHSGNYTNTNTQLTPAQVLTSIKAVDGSGSGLDADTVDGSHSNLSYGAGKQYDFTINGDADTFYPVVINGASNARMTRLTIFRGYSETAPSTWNTASHKGGLTLDMDVRFGGWGGYPNMINVHDFGEIYSRICGGAAWTAHTMKFVVWLRGGGASYHIDSPNINLSIEVNDSTSAENYKTTNTWYSYEHSNAAYVVTVVAKNLTEADTGANALLAYMPIRSNGNQNKVISGVAGLGYISSTGSMRAPYFYDSNDTSYYLDPASSSNLFSVTAQHFYGNLTGNASTATTATNLYGLGYIQSTSSGTSYQNNYQVRENYGKGSNTAIAGAPTLSFHWSGVVASSIMMEASGRIGIYNNPGTGYDDFIASTITASSSHRAPIFYDSDNTGYYLNPASTSNLNVINATGGSSNNWNTAYGWGNHADAGYTGDQDLSGYFPKSGGSLTGSANITGATADFTTVSSWNLAAKAGDGNGYSFWGTADNYKISMGNSGIYHYGDVPGYSIKTQMDSGSTDRGFTWGRVGAVPIASLNSTSGIFTTEGAIKAPVFYDSNNTGYYLNPSSTSNLNIVQAVQFQGSLAGTASNANTLDSFSSESFLRSDADDTVNAGVTYTWTRTDTAGLIFTNNSYNTKLYMGGWTTTNSNDISRIRTSSGNLHIDSAANGNTYLNWYSGGDVKTNSLLQSDASLRAPIFYDSNNTGYYLNPASTSNLNGLTVNGTITGNISGTAAAADDAKLLNGIDSSRIVYGHGDRKSTRADSVGIMSTTQNSGFHYGSSPTDGPTTDWNNWITCAGGAWTGGNNYDFKISHPFHSDKLYVGRMENGVNKGWRQIFTTGMSVDIGNNNFTGAAFYDANNTAYYINPASTSNLNVLVLAGTATASNFILSSDERKKTKIKDLPRNNINTNWKSFEMKNDEGEYRTGVIAQELEETHPEFVNTDPEGFKSVKYIDLLIAKIAELEARLEKLEK
jgi:hypothetical protein